jgi:hypothetical protein
MATLTNAQLNALSFGYLTGADLTNYVASQILIKCYEVNSASLQTGCDNAYSEMIGLFSTKYQVQLEFNQISAPRQQLVVKMTAILAIQDILGNMAGIGDVTKMNFAWVADKINRVQNGTFNLPLYAVNATQYSSAPLVQGNYSFLG